MDAILHIIGACSDTHTHIDLIDLLLMGGGFTMTITYLKHRIICIWKKIGKRKASQE